MTPPSLSQQPTILIAAPISSRAWVLSHYLDHLYDLNYDRKKIHMLFVLNNSIDNSATILNEFKHNHQHEYASITIEHFKSKYKFQDERTTNTRMKFSYYHLSDLRNYILLKMSEPQYRECSFLLSCDSDILVRPDTLNKLVSSNQKICAGLIYNGYLKNQSEPWRFPNILKKMSDGSIEHISNSYVKNAPSLTESKVSKVYASGAIILMDKEICVQTRYGFDKQGEDIFWSQDCENKGYEIYVDFSAFNYHIMNQKYLDMYLQDKNLLH